MVRKWPRPIECFTSGFTSYIDAVRVVTLLLELQRPRKHISNVLVFRVQEETTGGGVSSGCRQEFQETGTGICACAEEVCVERGTNSQ